MGATDMHPQERETSEWATWYETAPDTALHAAGSWRRWKRRPPRRWLLLAAGSGCVLLGAVVVVTGSGDESPVPAPAAPAPRATAGASSWCADAVAADGAVTTAAAGDTASGPGVIAAIEHAYYDMRSGATAAALAAPGSTLPPAQAIQAGIDAVPVGTKHCLLIRPKGDGVYSLHITERHPDGSQTAHDNLARVAETDGRYGVVSLTADPAHP
ncbi:hypothetical protein FOS14_23505 [Skermania sp. ID1734]|uniref:hypothetical protein n=1 Tax=Skermania sp. ID1734 TaxID=2597516 RepID=UPI0011816101|nr:hypothetical protein [Skermania sp. ID1734]TSD93267.1 hypothetical protein FOS14_23505 [Skermania sp. ID1734]